MKHIKLKKIVDEKVEQSKFKSQEWISDTECNQGMYYIKWTHVTDKYNNGGKKFSKCYVNLIINYANMSAKKTVGLNFCAQASFLVLNTMVHDSWTMIFTKIRNF